MEYTAAAGHSRGRGGHALVHILLRLVITALGVWLAATLFRGYVTVHSVEAALLFSIVLGLLNAFVRPVLLLLTLPFTLLTLGLFIVIVNAVVFWLATLLPVGVEVSGFLGALLGALTVSIVSFIASRFLP
jgi:putative membrane protein